MHGELNTGILTHTEWMWVWPKWTFDNNIVPDNYISQKAIIYLVRSPNQAISTLLKLLSVIVQMFNVPTSLSNSEISFWARHTSFFIHEPFCGVQIQYTKWHSAYIRIINSCYTFWNAHLVSSQFCVSSRSSGVRHKCQGHSCYTNNCQLSFIFTLLCCKYSLTHLTLGRWYAHRKAFV